VTPTQDPGDVWAEETIEAVGVPAYRPALRSELKALRDLQADDPDPAVRNSIQNIRQELRELRSRG
jgi:hypothetical protein